MRIRVSLSRSWTLGASSFVSLTRVCNAIRSALELEFGPLQDSIIPDFHRSQFKRVVQAKPNARNFAANLASKARIQKTVRPSNHSKASNWRSIDSNSGSLRWTTFGEALLKGSSDGMRSSQRCSESFSCEEKYSLTSKPTFPFAAAAAGFSAARSFAL